MTSLTFAPTPLGGSPDDPYAYAAGLADVHDDYQEGVPLGVLETRLEWLIDSDHHGVYAAYVHGYAAAVIRIGLYSEAVAAAQTTNAFEDHQNQHHQTEEKHTVSHRNRRHRTTAAPKKKTPLTVVPDGPAGLPHRQPGTTTPGTGLTEGQIAEARASAAAFAGGIHARILGWTASPSGGANQTLPDGAVLHHPGTPGAPFTALIACARGAHHTYQVTTWRDLHAARQAAATCPERHADLTQQTPPTEAEYAAAFPQPQPAADDSSETTTAIPVLALQSLQTVKGGGR